VQQTPGGALVQLHIAAIGIGPKRMPGAVEANWQSSSDAILIGYAAGGFGRRQ